VLLRHLRAGELSAAAGGDPWRVNDTIQAGCPGQIHDLASAFRDAGVCVSDTLDEFTSAKNRFQAAWDRHDADLGGDHPINDAAEVQDAEDRLQLNREQLTRVAADLETIAAALAEAQRSGRIAIGNLESALAFIDNQIDFAIALAWAEGRPADWTDLERAAVERTSAALLEVTSVRGAYADHLDAARLDMAAAGYPPDTLSGSDGTGSVSPSAQARADASKYAAEQRATDQTLVTSPGPWTPDKQAAQDRLRDYAVLTDPNADPQAFRHAAARLDDYHTAQLTGPFPIDPILGGNAATRAQFRQDWQRKLQQGLLGVPPMSADAATALLDRAEAQTRQLVIRQATQALQREGMSLEGAAAAISALSGGIPWDVLADATTASGAAGTGLTAAQRAAGLPGAHAVAALTEADLEVIERLGKNLGRVSTLGSIVLGVNDFVHGKGLWETAGGVAGGAAGSYLAGVGAWALAGSFVGPQGALVTGLVGSVVLGMTGEWLGGEAGRVLDR